MRMGKGIALAAVVAILFIVALFLLVDNEGMTPGGVALPSDETEDASP